MAFGMVEFCIAGADRPRESRGFRMRLAIALNKRQPLIRRRPCGPGGLESCLHGNRPLDLAVFLPSLHLEGGPRPH